MAHTHGTHTWHTHSCCRHINLLAQRKLCSQLYAWPLFPFEPVCVCQCECVCECVCVSGNGCPAHMQFIFLLPLLLYRSPDVASTKPASGFGLQLVLLVAVDLPLPLPLLPRLPALPCHAAIKFKCKTKGMLFDISQSCQAAKLPSCRGELSFASPCHILPTQLLFYVQHFYNITATTTTTSTKRAELW